MLSKNVFFIPLLITGISLSACVGTSNSSDSQNKEQVNVEYQVLNHQDGTSTNNSDTSTYSKVLSTQADYAIELAKFTNATPIQVDFDTQQVVLLTLGEKTSGGYELEVSQVRDMGSKVITTIDTKTGYMSDGSCTQYATTVMTYPYIFVRIDSHKPIEVQKRNLRCSDNP